jgi:hypothetical protein
MAVVGVAAVGPENTSQLIVLQFLGRCMVLGFMNRLICFLLSLLTTALRSRLSLQLEVAALRHQLSIYRRTSQRPRIAPVDRLLWSVIARIWADWRSALYVVQPRTVTVWQQKRLRDYWRALSRQRQPGRPRISPELRNLIRRMWQPIPPAVLRVLWRSFGSSGSRSLNQRWEISTP